MTDNAPALRNERTDRQSNIELLRIIAMAMIIGYHFVGYGEFHFDSHTISVPRLWANVLILGGNFGVDVFVLISGFFLIDNDEFRVRPKKVLKTWGQIVFYSILLFAAGLLTGKETLSRRSIVETLLPISFNRWWFASTYFVLYLLHPYVNRLLRSLTKKEYQRLLLFMLVIWSIVPSITTSHFQLSPLIEFVFYYSIAGYIKLHGFDHSYSSKKWFALWFGFYGLMFLLCIASIILGTKGKYFYCRHSILMICSAVCFFMAFLSMKIKTNRFINTVSSAAFGVYLLHDSSFLRPILWKEVFKNAQYRDSLFLIPYSILVIAIVYIGCTVIDLMRKRFFEKPYMLFVDRYTDTIVKPFSKIFDFLRNKIFG